MMRVVYFFGALLWLGCGTLTPPKSFTELKKMVESVDAGDPRYAVARQHFFHASEAIDNNDDVDAKRFSELGLIEARIAMTSVRQAALIELAEKESTRKQRLELETAQWQSKVDELIQQQARHSLRLHIETVIQKNVLEAAAQEEMQSHMGDVTSDTLEKAHAVVGRELAAMAHVRLQIAKLFVEKGNLIPEQLQRLEGNVELLSKANLDGELALAYQYAEQSLEQFLICRDDAWMLAGKKYSSDYEALLASLQEAGISVVNEEAGVAASMGLQGDVKNGTLSDDTKAMLEKARAVLEQRKNVHLLIWISGTRLATGRARKQSAALTRLLQENLDASNGTNSRISIFQLNGERPLNALVGERPQGALLFVPLP